MSDLIPGSPAWLEQIKEEIIDPDRMIVDPHHHLWGQDHGFAYLLDDLWADTGSGHRVLKTVFIECHAGYRTSGPEEMMPVGETEFVTKIARECEQGSPTQAKIAGIVSHADLTLGDAVEDVLAAHEEAGGTLFKGIRHAGVAAPDPNSPIFPGKAHENIYADQEFRQGMKALGRKGLTYETYHMHYQNMDFAELAKKVPETTMILDHFGTPLGVGPYEGRQDEVFEYWKNDIAEIARCENVYAKLGGMAMPANGFGWDMRAIPPGSDEFVEAQKRYYLHTIECFGPERCMFESNFPVDRLSLSYHVLWNALKKIVADFSEAEKEAMFSGTAMKVYRL